MILFENPSLLVEQKFFGGWKVRNKATGASSIPNRELRTKVGLVWMRIKRTDASASVDVGMTQDLMFGTFGEAVLDPTSKEGQFWTSKKRG